MTGALSQLALNISFGEFLLSLLIIFFMIVFFVILFQVVVDLFRSEDLSGWAKFGWLLLLVVLPYVGLFIYLIVRGPRMAKRQLDEQVEAKEQLDSYIRSVSGGAAGEIAVAKDLLDRGAITQDEFETIKRKHLS